MVRHFFGAVVRHVANHDAATACRFQIDVVETDAAADNAAALPQSGDGALGELDVMEDEQNIGLGGAGCHIRLVVGLQQDQVGNGVEDGALDAGFGEVIGDNDERTLGHTS